MICTGGIRGNGDQLASYVLKIGKNERIQILEVDGRENADPDYLRQTIMSMEAMAEMTKSDKAFFHAQISPAYIEDKKMHDNKQWGLAADIMAKEMGYEGQRRVIVLHERKGRIHAHVVFERYNYDTGKMIDNKFSRAKQNASRIEMETFFGHKPTAKRNPQKKEIKETVTKLWNKTVTGGEFLKAVRQAGYMVADGSGKRPFMIVDGNGRSFDLVRQIDGVRTKDVRARLRNEKLIGEKEAIDLMREEASKSSKRETQKTTAKPNAEKTAFAFAENRIDTNKIDKEQEQQKKNNTAFEGFKVESNIITDNRTSDNSNNEKQRMQEVAQAYKDNKHSGIDEQQTREQQKHTLLEEQRLIAERTRKHKRSR